VFLATVTLWKMHQNLICVVMLMKSINYFYIFIFSRNPKANDIFSKATKKNNIHSFETVSKSLVTSVHVFVVFSYPLV